MKKICFALTFLAISLSSSLAQGTLFDNPTPARLGDTLLIYISPAEANRAVAGAEFHYNIAPGAFKLLKIDSDIPVVANGNLRDAVFISEGENSSLNIVWSGDEQTPNGVVVPANQQMLKIYLELQVATTDDINELISLDQTRSARIIDTSVNDLEASLMYFVREGDGTTSVDQITQKGFKYSAAKAASITYMVSDMGGKVLTKASSHISAGDNLIEFPSSLEQHIHRGVYVLSVSDGKRSFSKKFFAF